MSFMARVGVEVGVGYARPVMVGFEVEGWVGGGGDGMVGWVGVVLPPVVFAFGCFVPCTR